MLAASFIEATGTPVNLLITLGSPLSTLSSDPTSVQQWINIASLVDPISWGSLTTGAQQVLLRGVMHTGYWNNADVIREIFKRYPLDNPKE